SSCAWPQALGFRMEAPLLSRTIGARRPVAGLMRLLRRDMPVPTPVGLEVDGAALLKPFCPPYYPSMSAAVRAYVDYKFSPGGGSLRADTVATAWREPEAVRQGIPGYSDEAIAATCAHTVTMSTSAMAVSRGSAGRFARWSRTRRTIWIPGSTRASTGRPRDLPARWRLNLVGPAGRRGLPMGGVGTRGSRRLPLPRNWRSTARLPRPAPPPGG